MDGFIPGSRGSFMLDLVAIAMIIVLPLLGYAISLAKKRQYEEHRKAMLAIGSLLGVTVLIFEIEMRFSGWKHLAESSPYFDSAMPITLGVHLLFSISTAILLSYTLIAALRKFPKPTRPSPYSKLHKLTGKATAVGLFLTSVSGWIFYYLAFIAT